MEKKMFRTKENVNYKPFANVFAAAAILSSSFKHFSMSDILARDPF